MLKILKEDEVIVIAGRDKGRRGDVLEVLKDGRLLVSGVNLLKKHQRPNPNAGQQGGIVEREGPIQVSNIAIWNDEEEKADRIGFREEDGPKVRFYKPTGQVVPHQPEMTDLYKRYLDEIRPALLEQLGVRNVMQVPKLEKVTLNMGVGEAVGDRKIMEHAVADMALIAGQQPIVRNARKSEAGFKIREGWPVGCKVTLRGSRMYEFVERLIGIAIPRIRDFRGLNPKAFDGRGNFSMGIQEQIVFAEIDYDKIDKIRGLNITVNTSARRDEEALSLLRAFSFPFKDLSGA